MTKEGISRLIGQGKTKEALLILEKYHSDALLLQGQYNTGEKRQNLGLISYQEWERTLARINFAALDIASQVFASAPVFVHTTNFVYVTYIAQQDTPGNELALFRRMFRSLEQMAEDLDFPLSDIGEIVAAIDRHIGTPEIVAAFEDFSKSAYTQSADAHKTLKRREFVEELLQMKDEILGAMKELVEDKQKRVGWKEAWALLCKEPSKEKWGEAKSLIEERLLDPIFDTGHREKWAALSAPVDEIPKTLLWRKKFEGMLPDLKRWVEGKMH